MLDGGTINLGKYTLTIITTGSTANSIYTEDDLTIKGTGTLNITSAKYGIYAYVAEDNTYGTANITITDASVDITSSGNGIYAYVDYKNETGIANIIIGGSANVNVKTTGYTANGINAGTGDITIEDSANVAVNAKGSGASGIQASGNNIKITTTGNVTVYAAGSGINTGSTDGSITITDATVVNTSVNSINSPTIKIDGNANVSSTSKLAVGDQDDSFTLDDTATLNAVVTDNTTKTYTVYGNVVATSTLQAKDLFNGQNELSFKENSTLTINEGVAVSLVEYKNINWDNANVINNGVIYLINDDYYSSVNGETADVSDIASLNITGDGYIVRMAVPGVGSADDNYRTVEVYNNDGIAVDYVIKTAGIDGSQDTPISLNEATGNDYYTWIVENGVGTLTVEKDLLFNGGTEIEGVTDVKSTQQMAR